MSIKPPANCVVCQTKLGSFASFSYHLMASTSCRVRQFSCRICSKSFIWPATLLRHTKELHMDNSSHSGNTSGSSSTGGNDDHGSSTQLKFHLQQPVLKPLAVDEVELKKEETLPTQPPKSLTLQTQTQQSQQTPSQQASTLVQPQPQQIQPQQTQAPQAVQVQAVQTQPSQPQQQTPIKTVQMQQKPPQLAPQNPLSQPQPQQMQMSQKDWCYCEFCHKAFLNQTGLALHMKKFHSEMLQNRSPSQYLDYGSSPLEHGQKKRGRKPGTRVCKMCKKTFQGTDNLLLHLQHCHQDMEDEIMYEEQHAFSDHLISALQAGPLHPPMPPNMVNSMLPFQTLAQPRPAIMPQQPQLPSMTITPITVDNNPGTAIPVMYSHEEDEEDDFEDDDEIDEPEVEMQEGEGMVQLAQRTEEDYEDGEDEEEDEEEEAEEEERVEDVARMES